MNPWDSWTKLWSGLHYGKCIFSFVSCQISVWIRASVETATHPIFTIYVLSINVNSHMSQHELGWIEVRVSVRVRVSECGLAQKYFHVLSTYILIAKKNTLSPFSPLNDTLKLLLSLCWSFSSQPKKEKTFAFFPFFFYLFEDINFLRFSFPLKLKKDKLIKLEKRKVNSGD